MPKRLTPLLLLLLGVLLCSGCGSLNPFASSKSLETAQELFRAGEKAMEEEDYGEAAEYFQRIKEEHPFSRRIADAELGLADARFRQGKYSAAESAYKEFESLHPGSPEIPYVLFRIGLANLKQFTSIDLSQEEAREAEEHFTRLVQAYPQSEHASRAREYVRKCRKYRAQHAIYVADFYMRTEKYRAAWLRYSSVIEKYEDLEKLAEYAESRAREAYFLSLRQASEETRIARRGSWKEWFDWL
jgi:outer membrane protein assembly factor BamD